MSKHRYRTTECKQVDWARLGETVMGQRVVLSIDVAKEDFVSAFMVEDNVAIRIKWRHPNETLDWLSGVKQVATISTLEAVMEPSGTYGDAVRHQLTARGIEVYLVSPKRVHDGAEVYDGVPSLHDAKAVEIIGYLHRQGFSRPWPDMSADRRAVEAQLSRYWPESLGIHGQKSLTLQHVLASYGGPGSINAHEEEAQALMRRVGEDK